jgi:hypothetical protein
VALAALAVAKENPYQPIIDRNAFGLKPPPPPPTNVVQETPPLTVKLTGVTSLGGEPKAFFQMTEPGPGKQPKWPPAMTRGEKLDGVEVLEIDVDKGEVKIKNGTIETTLNFEKDGIKSAPGAAAAPKTAAVAPLTLPSVRPGTSPITTPTMGSPIAASASSGVTVTGGSGTLGASPVTVTGGSGTAMVTGGGITPATPSFSQIPTRNLRTPGAQVGVNPGFSPITTPAPQIPPARPQSYEESVLNVAVMTEATRSLVEQGQHPPFPPTEITPHPPRLPGAIDLTPQLQAPQLQAPIVPGLPGVR